MIHFTCDGCGRSIHPDEETRYVVRLEVYAAADDGVAAGLDDADHLDEIEDLLERIDDLEQDEEQLYRQVRYDLCPACRERFLNNPFGRGVARMGFSEN